MPLTGKYLKYQPEITFDIFKLVWDRLLELGWKENSNSSIESRWIEFTSKYPYFRHTTKKEFNTHEDSEGRIETTVQEILGYDPFVKDDFVLPEKWYIKTTSDSNELVCNLFDSKEGNKTDRTIGNYYTSDNEGWMHYAPEKVVDYTEITFEQFKKYVLKESIETSKEVIPEYVECIENTTQNPVGIVLGKIYKVLSKTKCSCTDLYLLSDTKCNSSSKQCWDCNEKVPSNSYKVSRFKPSTKEAFDAQNKPIEKWSIGSYFVIEKDRLYNISSSKRGDICIIKKDKTFNFINKKDQTDWCFDLREGSKWFATKVEAEEFAKTLIPMPEFKEPLKQAVHCKTQEEWDFVTEKCNFTWNNDNFLRAKNNCIIISNKTWDSVETLTKLGNYQILSFQEWCDLNGYKMETNQEFKVGDWVCNKKRPDKYIGQITEIKNGYIYYCGHDEINSVRHATPEEINNHLISIGQISVGEPLNNGIEPNKDGVFKYTTYNGTTVIGKTSTISGPLKMTLSIDDEELPMVNIIKTNTIKQLLNND